MRHPRNGVPDTIGYVAWHPGVQHSGPGLLDWQRPEPSRRKPTVRQKFDLGSVLAAVGALALLVSLFLHWYATVTAWTSFEIVDWLLAALAVATLVGVVRGAVDGPGPARWLPLAGGAALLLVGSQLIDPPPAVHGASRQVGAWMALGAALAMTVGGALAAASISVVVDVRGRERRVRMPAVDRREAAVAAEAPPSSPPPPPEVAADPDPDRTQPFRPLTPAADRERERDRERDRDRDPSP